MHLSSLARHNDLVLLRLFDPLEAELPQAGWYSVSDGDRFVAIDSGDRARRQAHREQFLEQQFNLEQICRRQGIHLLQCATNEELSTILQNGLGRQTL